ncbi:MULTISPECIES: M55 family metallopeptidase [Anaerolinea]|uniref:M55 family metallopeptidase n=1 Tax=Anaerolinea TaxID=233189 RepID=UPI0026265025|nr:M55 family metallopeptidase [Anaerolinea thermophila]
MKLYVVCDLEGVAGVVHHPQQCRWDADRGWYAPFLEQARRLATLELNALVEGALSAGAEEIIAWDGHGNFPGGLEVELLHPACKLIMDAGDGGPAGLDSSFDALLQLGLHAMAGTPRAVLAHSFFGNLLEYTVNGEAVGEIWMNAYTAGKVGVPFIFLSGDRAAALEARQLVPDVEVAIVKEGLSEEAIGLDHVQPALCLSPQAARETIRKTVARALWKVGKVAPFTRKPPFTLRARFSGERFAEERAGQPGVRRVDACTVELVGADEPWLLL